MSLPPAASVLYLDDSLRMVGAAHYLAPHPIWSIRKPRLSLRVVSFFDTKATERYFLQGSVGASGETVGGDAWNR